MPEDLLSDDDSHVAKLPRRRSRSQPLLVLLGLSVAALVSAGICVAAIVARAPVAVAPLVAAVCVGGPLFAGWEVPSAVTSWRAERARSRAVAALRRGLKQLPETEHPLGL
jgi:hypothetical protein